MMNFLSTGASNLNFALLQREKERGKEGEFSPKGIFDSFLCKSYYLDILCLNRKSSTPPPLMGEFFSVLYSTLLHLLPLRFHCVGG